MKKILYSIYTGEYPNESTGGPNNIIYKIIRNATAGNFSFDYLSKDLFARNLNNINVDSIINKRTPKKKITAYLANNLKIYRKIFGSDFYLPYHFVKNERYFKSFQKKIKNYHILHSHDSVSLALLTDKNQINVKKIMTVHSKGPLSDELKEIPKSKKIKNRIDTKIKAIELKNVELADLITFPSIAAKVFFEESLNISLKDKVKIIYNGIDFSKISELQDNEILRKYSIDKKNKLLFINIAANAPEKKLNVLLRVLGLLKNKFNKEILLLNIGTEKKIANEYRNIIKEMYLQSDVKFLGKLPNEDVIKLLKSTDILIMTSEKVIFDLVVLEAMAAGTCCVVSNEGGNKEIITDGENGFLIDIADVDAIAKKIISILPYKDKVRENAIKTARQFSVQKMVNEYFEVYKNV